MKFRPESPDRTEGIPSAEPGTYVMRISAWIEDKQTKKGTKDLVEFVGETDETSVGASMWISHPENGKKGNLWKYRQLAEALGDDAVEQYRSKDKDGYSLFNPMSWTDRRRGRGRSVRRRDGLADREAAEHAAGVEAADRGQLGQERRRDHRRDRGREDREEGGGHDGLEGTRRR